MSQKIGIYLRLSKDVVEWLRRKLPAKKGAISSYIEDLIRKEMNKEDINKILNEIDRLVIKRIESEDLPRIRRELEKRLMKEI